MQTTFTPLQILDATPDRPLIDAYNRHMARNHPAFRLIVNKQVRPCFFSGDIEEPGMLSRSVSTRRHRRGQVRESFNPHASKTSAD